MGGIARRSVSGLLFEHPEPLAGGALRDQRGETALSRLLLLRAGHPVRGEPLVVRSLGTVELPGLPVGLDLLLVARPEAGGLALDRAGARPLRVGLRERREPGRRHAALLLQHGHALDVHVAPDALRLARREPDAIARRVDAVADAVDPAEAQRLVDRLRPGDAGPARAPLV